MYRILPIIVASFLLIGAGCARSTPPKAEKTETPSTPSASATPRAYAPVPDATSSSTIEQTSEASAPKTHTAVIKDFTFSPLVIKVKIGDTVIWKQEDTVAHNVVANDQSFSGPLLAKGQTFSHTFMTPGSFQYFCRPHPWMQAVVIVD